jgi:hypothetical protein
MMFAVNCVWDNDLQPDPRMLAQRIARIERHLGIGAVTWRDGLDPPETW